MNCKRCKTVAYCSAECQRQDWKEHKPHCQRTDIAGAPCDVCHGTDKAIQDTCLSCGSLFCAACDEATLVRNSNREIVSFKCCPGCQQRRRFRVASDYKLLEKLVREKPDDPRLAVWLTDLGSFYIQHLEPTQSREDKAMEQFLRAGELGYGAGYSCIGDIYIRKRNWSEAKRYFRRAADLHHVGAIEKLACEATLGYFKFTDVVQYEQRRPPDPGEAFRLNREGARLDHPVSCRHLGLCYMTGSGTGEDYARGFKWLKRAADKGDALAMQHCGICYLQGAGVEQSNAQAMYWLEKSLGIEENEETRSTLEALRRRQPTGAGF